MVRTCMENVSACIHACQCQSMHSPSQCTLFTNTADSIEIQREAESQTKVLSIYFSWTIALTQGANIILLMCCMYVLPAVAIETVYKVIISVLHKKYSINKALNYWQIIGESSHLLCLLWPLRGILHSSLHLPLDLILYVHFRLLMHGIIRQHTANNASCSMLQDDRQEILSIM